MADRDAAPSVMEPTNANPLDAEKLSAARGVRELQQPLDVNNRVGDQDTDNYRIREDGVTSFEQVGGDSGHEENQEGQGNKEKEEPGKVLHGQTGGHDQDRGNERGGDAEIASAPPDGEGQDGREQQDERPQTVLQEEKPQKRKNGLPGEEGRGELDPVGVLKGACEHVRAEAGETPEERQSDGASGGEDGKRRHRPDMADPQHEGQCRKQYHPQRPLRADTERDGDAHEENALPVPEHNIARSVERMGCSDAGEDQAECSPCAYDVRLDLAGARNNHGREAIKTQGDIAAKVAVEAASNVPERSSEKQAGEEKR